MASFEKVFNLEKEKNANKLYTALDNGCGRNLLDAFMAEAKSSSAQDFKYAQVMITDHYVCHYGFFPLQKRVYIIPTEDIINVYFSNCYNGTYDYDNKMIALETKNDEIFYIAKCLRKRAHADFQKAFETLVSRCKQNDGNLIA
jgi:hypothetical protein